jgi:leader peptidase (prepilin peptidase)/N-methyltransferase
MVVVWAGLIGGVIGSFLNVVIYRFPAGMSLVRPASACPTCHTAIAGRDNIPVLSWVLLRGRCRTCREPISRRYPAVELLTAVLFVAVALHFGTLSADGWAIGPFWVLAALGVALSGIDLDTQRLPDPIVGFGYVAGGVALLAASLAGAGDGMDALGRAALGAAGLFSFYLAAWFAYPAGMGFGDVKLAGLLGMFLAWAGWGTLAVGALAAFVVGVGAVIVLALVGRARRGIPFGPAMFAGAALGIAFGQPLWAKYLQVMGL